MAPDKTSLGPLTVISAIVPVYNEEGCLRQFHAELTSTLRSQPIRYEILYIDDGSTDGSAGILHEFQAQDAAVAVVHMTRNFGHQTALTAGLELAKGDAVITLDCDLQHPPELILRLLAEWRAGAKVVHTVREETEDIGPLKKTASALFYRLINFLSSTPIRANAADFRLLDRQAVDMLKTMNERNRFLRGMIAWLGLAEVSVSFKAPKRAAGKSKYTWRKMLRMGADGIASFSIQPLRLALWLGLAVLSVNAVYATYVLHHYIFYNTLIQGWASLILLMMFLGSSQLIMLGVIGEYIGRIYEESKSRPLFLVRELRPHRLP